MKNLTELLLHLVLYMRAYGVIKEEVDEMWDEIKVNNHGNDLRRVDGILRRSNRKRSKCK